MGKEVLGWREWISLPDLRIRNVKCKVDTGARTSALHATHIKVLSKTKIRFTVYPSQENSKGRKSVTARLKGFRKVTSSIGISTKRPVILTSLKVGNESFKTEITLVDREVMGFRMLLGRQSLNKRFVVDPGRSFLSGAPRKAQRLLDAKRAKKSRKKKKWAKKR